jgi:hypothetical protein
VLHDTRDQIVDFVRRWSEKTEIGAGRFIVWLDITASKFYDWRERYGKVNEHNGWVPRDFWLEQWEKQAIIGFHLKNPLEGYRRLTFMMLDADTVAVTRARLAARRQCGAMERQRGAFSRRRADAPGAEARAATKWRLLSPPPARARPVVPGAPARLPATCDVARAERSWPASPPALASRRLADRQPRGASPSARRRAGRRRQRRRLSGGWGTSRRRHNSDAAPDQGMCWRLRPLLLGR